MGEFSRFRGKASESFPRKRGESHILSLTVPTVGESLELGKEF